MSSNSKLNRLLTVDEAKNIIYKNAKKQNYKHLQQLIDYFNEEVKVSSSFPITLYFDHNAWNSTFNDDFITLLKNHKYKVTLNMLDFTLIIK